MNIDFTEIANRISHGFDQAKQFAQEKMGTAEEITAYPPDFRLLEEKFDNLKVVCENLIKINQQLINSDRYSPDIQESMFSAFSRINDTIASHSSTGMSPIQLFKDRTDRPIPHTVYEAAARISSDGALALAPSDEMTDALIKYGEVMQKVGSYKSELERSIQEKFIKQVQNLIEVLFAQASSARKILYQSRLNLDAIKSKCKSASPDRMESLQKELLDSEKKYQTSLEDAIRRIKTAVENPLIVQHMSDLVDSIREFHKRSYEALNGVVIL